MTTVGACVFCDIVAGTAPARRVFEDETVVAFLDIRPISRGHVLVVPRAHAARLEELAPDDGAAMFRVGQRLARALARSDHTPDGAHLVLNDGRSRLGQPSTVVKVGPQGLEILRQGVVSEQTLRRLSCLMVLLVCTGNTCRSPMAEVMCRKMIADRLGCSPAELGDRGVIVTSAGISAMMGARPSAEAVSVMAKAGLPMRLDP